MTARATQQASTGAVAAGSGVSSATNRPVLILQIRNNGSDREVFLQHGLSIGRLASNAICIDDPAVERLHAQMLQQPDGSLAVVCQGEHAHLTLSDGREARDLRLQPGVTFKIAQATFRCLKIAARSQDKVDQNP